jgi:hypothetical protein
LIIEWNDVVANQEAIIFIDSDNFTNGNMSTLKEESIQITQLLAMLILI